VFARLLEHLPRLAEPSRLQAWIVTTAKREALLQRRLGQRHQSLTRADESDDEAAAWDVADESPIAEEALSELQQLNQLRVAMDRLDERCRHLLLLLFRDEDEKLSYEEVARRQGTSVGSIGPTRSRCLDKLRTLVA
jgi:RNA polymerase sigma factor (sigma-70 family)